MADDRFGKRIILLNKKKVCSFTNVKPNKFFRIMMTLNILSFWLYRKIISQTTDITSHSNHYSFIAMLLNISFMVNYMINDSIFEEKLGRTGISNNIAISAFSDLFYIGNTYLSNSITLNRYINYIQDNWDNFDLDDRPISDIVNNDSLESRSKDPN